MCTWMASPVSGQAENHWGRILEPFIGEAQMHESKGVPFQLLDAGPRSVSSQSALDEDY